MTLSPPTRLTSDHEVTRFACGEPSLDAWLKDRAIRNQLIGASRTYVVLDANRVVGYYCLSADSLLHADAPGALRRNMPNPIPVVLLGRLAIDRSVQGQKLGSALLHDAVNRALEAAKIIGINAVVVVALNDPAARFYVHHGFQVIPGKPSGLVFPLKKYK